MGRWISVYDGAETTRPGTFDVDHVVPLAEAHQSGGWRWDNDTKQSYANYLSAEHHLIAVSASSNRSKGAKDPAEWLPPDTEILCAYLLWWTAIKSSWELTMDETEHSLISAYADNDCANTNIETPKLSTPNIKTNFPTIEGLILDLGEVNK